MLRVIALTPHSSLSCFHAQPSLHKDRESPSRLANLYKVWNHKTNTSLDQSLCPQSYNCRIIVSYTLDIKPSVRSNYPVHNVMIIIYTWSTNVQCSLFPLTYLNVYFFTERSLTLDLHRLHEELVCSCHELHAEIEVITREQAPSSVEVLQ